MLTSINQIANGSQFNGITLFSGTAVTFQVGATNTANDQLTVTINKADTTTLAINGTNLTTQANAQAALTKVTTRAGDDCRRPRHDRSVRAVVDRDFEQPAVDPANLTSALSTIQDANVAQTYATFSKQTVLQQAGVQVLKQADQTPSQLLALFQ